MTWSLLNPLLRRASRALRRRPARRPRPAFFRPRLDHLEARVVPATVHWIRPTSGTWATAANWDSNAVPGAGDDVVIDVPGNITITHDTGTDTVQSLVSRQNLILSGTSTLTITGSFMQSSGRSLTVRDTAHLTVNGAATTTGADLTAGGGAITLNGTATMTGGNLTAPGGIITFAGAATVAGINLSAQNGGTISLPGATAYNGSGGVSLTVRATGAGSRVDLSHVTQWQGAGSAANSSWVSVEALNGGTVDLRQVAQLTAGNTRFLAQGAGSQINLTALTGFTGARNDANILEADTGGTITAPNLASLGSVSLRMSGGATLPTGQVATFQNGNVLLDNGASLALPSVTRFNGAGNRNLTLQADHGSRLDLSPVTQYQGAGSATNSSTVLVQALNGGTVDLSRVTQLAAGNISFQSSGTGSQINLAALTSFTGARADASVLEADTGGTILAPNLTGLNTVDLRVAGTGTLPTAHVATLQNGDIYLAGGANLALPLVTGFNGSGIHTLTFQADQGSRLDLSALMQWQGAGGATDHAAVLVQALNGGTVDLSRVTQITAGNTAFQSTGTGSQILLTALTGFTGARTDSSSLEANTGGTISAPALASLNDITLKATGTGTLPTAHVGTLLNSAIALDGNANVALPALTRFNGAGNRTLTLQADHGSRLDLSAVTQWQGAGSATDPSNVLVQALNGAAISLGGITQITTGNTTFQSTGSGSQILLTALTSFTGARADGSSLEARTGGAMTAPNLTSLNDITLRVVGGGTLPTSQVTMLLNSDVFVDSGGTLALPALTSFDGSGSRNLTLQADHGGRLDLSHVTQWQGAGDGSDPSAVIVQTLNGGTIDISQLPQVAVGNTFFWSEGAGSQINLAALTSFTGARADATLLQADTGGTIALGSGTTAVTAVPVVLAGAGVVKGGTIQLATGSYLAGSGTVMANLVNNAQVLTVLPTDTIVVAGAYQQTTAGTLGGVGTLTVNGLLTWQGGTMTDPGRTNAASGLVLSGPAVKTLDGRALNVGGAGTWTGGDLDIGDGAVFTILPAGTLDAQSDQVVLNLLGGDAEFVNAGLFRRSVGVGITNFQVPYANPGTLQVLAGAGVKLTGPFLSVDGTTLTEGTYLISGTFQIVNPSLTSNAGAITLDGTTSGFINQSGRDVLANLDTNTGSLTVQNGRRFTTGGDFTNTGTLTVGTGGTLTVTGSYTQTGALVIRTGGSLSLLGGGTVDGSVTDAGTLTPGAGAQLTVSGRYTETGTLVVPAGALVAVPGTLTNLAGGTLTGGTFQVAGALQLPGTVTTNAATLILDGPDAQVYDPAWVSLPASLALNTGGLTVRNGGGFTTWANLANGGMVTVAAGSTLTVSGVYSQADTGTLQVQAGGSLVLKTGGTAAGTLRDAGSLTLGPGAFLTVLGSYTETGTLTVSDTALLSIAGTLTNLAGGTLTGGTFQVAGVLQLPGTLTANAAAVVLDGPDALITDLAFGDLLAGLSANSGSLTVRDGGSFTTWVDFANGGTLTVMAASSLTVFGAYTQAGAGSLTVQTGGRLNLLGGGTAAGTLRDAGAFLVGSGAVLTVTGTYTETGAVTVADAAVLTVSGTLTNLAGNGTLTGGTFQIAGVWQLNGLLTTNAAALVLDGPDAQVYDLAGNDLLAGLNTNQGSLTIQNGAALTTGGRFINNGTIRVAAGGGLSLAGAYTQSGSLTVLAGGTLALSGGGSAGGTFSDAGLVTVAYGTTFTVAGTYTERGTLSVPAGATLVMAGTLTNLADGTLIGGTFQIAGALRLPGALTTNAATLILDGPAAQVTDLSGNDLLAGLPANSGSLTIRDDSFTAGGDFANSGTITVTADSTLSVFGTFTQTGTGTLIVQAGGSLYLYGGTVAGTLSDAGSLTLGGGSAVTLTGNYTETGTLTVPDAAVLSVAGTFTNLAGGTLTGGTFQIVGALQLAGTLTATAATIVLDGPHAQVTDLAWNDILTGLTANSGNLTVRSIPYFPIVGDFANTGSLTIQNVPDIVIEGNWSNAGNLSIQNDPYVVIGGSLSNSGTLTVGVASTLSVFGACTQTGAGTLTVQAGSSLYLYGGGSADGHLSDAGLLTVAGGSLTLSGSYTETGTLTVGDGAVLTIAGTFTNLAGGTLTGGTFQVAGVLQLPGTLTTNATTLTLDGPDVQVTDLAGNDLLAGLTANSSNLTVRNGAYLAIGGTFTNSGTLAVASASIVILFGAFNQTAAGTLTVLTGGGVYVYGGGTAAGTFSDAGTFTVVSGSTLTLSGRYTEAGTLTVVPGATLAVTGTFSNFAASTLTGGTFIIGGTFQFTGARIVTNEATLVLDGPNSRIIDESANDALAGFATNAAAGSFTLQNGRSFTTGGAFTNLGHLTLGAGSTLTVTGDFTQGAAATLEVLLGGTPDTGQFGRLVVTGRANLDGSLQITLANGYVPGTGDAFRILTYASRGTPATNFAHPPAGFDLNYDDVAGSLTIVAQ